ncbi:hypothetical protein GS530_01230 [Rhodococcus hoagii]|nr:hypothetical protein [Prescottella equi]
MTVAVAASPRGARVGFLYAGAASAQLLLTVAPKAWRDSDQPRNLAIDTARADGHYAVTLYETDRLQIRNNLELEELAERCTRRSSRWQASDDQWGEGLLHPDIPPSDPRPMCVRTGAANATTDLLRLFDKVNLVRTQADSVSASLHQSPIHRQLLYRRFLDEVQNRISSVRRGYQPVSAVHTTLHGRASAAALARYAATGDPRIECRYSQLTTSTTLLRIVCSALDWIADGRMANSGFTGEFSTTRLRHDAVGLRRALADVRSAPIKSVVTDGPRLHLTRLDRPWADAFDMSLAILHAREHIADSSDRDTDAVELSVRTDKLWESIVQQLLHRAGFSEVRDQDQLDSRTVVDPWHGAQQTGPRTYPDFVAELGNTLVVVDAKYKMRDKRTSPSRADQYQMFAYSHLVANGARSVSRSVLVYPGIGEPARWTRGRDSSVALDVCSIPFPAPVDVRDGRTWDRYLDRSGSLLAQHLRLLDYQATLA